VAPTYKGDLCEAKRKPPTSNYSKHSHAVVPRYPWELVPGPPVDNQNFQSALYEKV
jgi:hypothetical protein